VPRKYSIFRIYYRIIYAQNAKIDNGHLPDGLAPFKLPRRALMVYIYLRTITGAFPPGHHDKPGPY
jgi:hypothetical protein